MSEINELIQVIKKKLQYHYNKMGCTTSDNEWPSSTLIRNLSDDKKQKIVNAIQINDLIQLAILMEKHQAYPNSEISEPQKGWMLVHLCCRWDSDFCLEYLLKLYFFENPKGYINFVNSQTVEGYTCLHLCCIWNSVKCVKVLNSFGGLYLKIRDKKLKTPYQNALQYKCSQILLLLKQYQKLNVEFVFIQVERMLQNPLIPAQYDENSYRIQFQKYNLQIKRQLYEKNLQENETTELQLKLLQQKYQIQTELDKLLQEKLKRQLDYDLKRSLILVYIKVQQLEKQQFLKIQKEKLVQQLQKQKLNMQNQISEKDQSLKIIYGKIREFQIQRFQRIKESSYARNQQKFANFNMQMTNKIKQLYKNLQVYKKIGNKHSRGRQTLTVSRRSNNQVSNKQLSKLPKQIVKLYIEAKQNGQFVDKQFPAENQSIGDMERNKYNLFTSNTVWLRPKQFFKQEFLLFDGIDPDDIKQGSLGVCYMLATLSALAANPKNIKQIFQFYDLDIGFYVLKLFVNGIPKYFVVDDLIPCCKTTKSPLFTQPIGKQIWVLLLEKAWVKLIGNYLSAQSMTADHVMQDLSGAPGYGWWLTKQKLKTPTQKIKQIARHCQLGHIVVLTSADIDIQGIVKNHAYSLLSVVEYNNRYIFKIRNPWGCFEWNGQFSQKSSLCNEQFKKKVKYQNKQKGVFYISQNQLLKAFCFYSISHIKPEYLYSYSQFKSRKWQSVYYKFKLTKSGEINIRVTQPFDRMLKDKEYQYSPMIFQVGKIISGNQVNFITQGHHRTYFGAKSVHAFQDIFQNFDKGQYFIRVRMIWVNEAKFNSAVLGVYASQPVVLQRIQQNKGSQLLKALFISFSKTFVRNTAPNGFYRICTMKGQFLFIGETDQQGLFKVNFKFIKQKMIRTQTDIGKVGYNELEVITSKGQPGVCTAMRTDPSQGGTTGPVSITITRISK